MAQWLREMSVGEWFEADGEPFEIIGVDAKSGIILIQYFGGALDEVDFETWEELSARPCAPPEDYTGALDVDGEDYDDSAFSSHLGDPIEELTSHLDDYL